MTDSSSNRLIKILLTEDDLINQEVATIMLESIGCQVQIACNGSMALDTLQNDSSIDLVLMDCQMPVMDGVMATKAIRGLGLKIPIIALTANETPEDREICLNSGMNDHITKPIDQTDLARVVQQWVPPNRAETVSDNNENTSEIDMNVQIDETALDAIRALQRPGKPDILARIVNMYIEKTPELISSIKEGIAANDSDKVKMAAHTLKSSSAYVGASSLADVCARVESNAANDNLSESASDVELLSSGYESVASQINQYA